MLSRRRRFVRFSAPCAFGLLALVVISCGTYGEDATSTSVVDAAEGDGSVVEGASTTDGPAAADSPSGDVASDAPVFAETCPPCTGTCLASGCSGVGPIVNTCSAPFDVVDSTSLLVFLCPEGATSSLPSGCTNDTGPTKHVAAVRLGDKGMYKVTASAPGGNPLIAVGDCENVTACSGGLNTTSLNVPKLSTVLISTTNDINACLRVSVEIEAIND